jgi:hypothetical protein
MNIKPVPNYGAGILPAPGGALAVLFDSDPMVVRANILALKDEMLAMTSGQIDMPVEHTVADGMYMRKLFIPKGSVVVGKIHRKACMNIVASGDITILTETGCARVTAGYTVQSPPGLMKVGLAHEDTVFVNVFRTDETDIAKIEAEIACESFEALAAPAEITEALCQ